MVNDGYLARSPLPSPRLFPDKMARMRRSAKAAIIGACRERPSCQARDLKLTLRSRPISDEWSSGEQLPTVAALAKHYDVTRGTVASALRTIESEGDYPNDRRQRPDPAVSRGGAGRWASLMVHQWLRSGAGAPGGGGGRRAQTGL